MINTWLQALETPTRYLRICFLDFSKAFDRINHGILITKLIDLGVRRSLIPWVCDFLTNRRQAVKIGEIRSEWVYVNGGVPQGTKLGPVLFLVMINDLEMKSDNSSHWKFVDDVTISEVVTTSNESHLQSDLEDLQRWASENDMKLNGRKCKEMTISFLRCDVDCPPLEIDGHQLERVATFKILGLTINNTIKWSECVDVIVRKSSKRLYMLRVLCRSGIPITDLLVIYNASIRPILEYACVVWHNSLPKYLSDKFELVQKRALRILYPNTHYEDALSSSGCSRLHVRRQDICRKTFQKIARPTSKLYNLLPATREEACGRNLRNCKHRSVPRCKTERFKRSFIPAMCYDKNINIS